MVSCAIGNAYMFGFRLKYDQDGKKCEQLTEAILNGAWMMIAFQQERVRMKAKDEREVVVQHEKRPKKEGREN